MNGSNFGFGSIYRVACAHLTVLIPTDGLDGTDASWTHGEPHLTFCDVIFSTALLLISLPNGVILWKMCTRAERPMCHPTRHQAGKQILCGGKALIHIQHVYIENVRIDQAAWPPRLPPGSVCRLYFAIKPIKTGPRSLWKALFFSIPSGKSNSHRLNKQALQSSRIHLLCAWGHNRQGWCQIRSRRGAALHSLGILEMIALCTHTASTDTSIPPPLYSDKRRWNAPEITVNKMFTPELLPALSDGKFELKQREADEGGNPWFLHNLCLSAPSPRGESRIFQGTNPNAFMAPKFSLKT